MDTSVEAEGRPDYFHHSDVVTYSSFYLSKASNPKADNKLNTHTWKAFADVPSNNKNENNKKNWTIASMSCI